MIWNLDAITPGRPALTSHCMTIERYALKWVKQLSRERRAPLIKVIRTLLAQAVADWRKEGHTSGSPWGNEAEVGPVGKITTVLLDNDTLTGLREIQAVSGKTLSRLTSEILLDAMTAETARMQRLQPVIARNEVTRQINQRRSA
jgi:hypothetical protein